MKVVIAHRTGQAKVVELPEPKGGRHFVTVRISHSAMRLPEEILEIEQAPKRIPPGQDGLPVGSMASGTIVSCGAGVRSLKTGLRVAVAGAPYVYHASQLVVPEHLAVELPKKVNHEEGAFAGQGAVALHLLRTGRVQLGEIVLVMGADMLGLLTVQVVRAAGAIPILVDESEFRLNKARAVGIAHAFVPRDEALVRTVDQLSDGHGADTALLTQLGDDAAFARAAQLLRFGGRLVLGVPLFTSAPLDSLREKRLELLHGVGGGPQLEDPDEKTRGLQVPRAVARWSERDNMGCFTNLLAERKVQLSPLISDRLPIERAPTAYEKAGRGRDSVLGVVLTM